MIINTNPSSSSHFISPHPDFPTTPPATLDQALTDLSIFQTASSNSNPSNPSLSELLGNFKSLLNNVFTKPSGNLNAPLSWDSPPFAFGMEMMVFFKGLLLNNLTTYPYSPTNTQDPTFNALVQYLSSFNPTATDNWQSDKNLSYICFFANSTNSWGPPNIYNETFLKTYPAGISFSIADISIFSPIPLMASMETCSGWAKLATDLEVGSPADNYCTNPGLELLMLSEMNNIPITPPVDSTSRENWRYFSNSFATIFHNYTTSLIPVPDTALNIYQNFAILLEKNGPSLKSAQALGASYRNGTLQSTLPLPPYNTLSSNQQSLWIVLTGLNLPPPTQT